jgi:hypothetical protein
MEGGLTGNGSYEVPALSPSRIRLRFEVPIALNEPPASDIFFWNQGSTTTALFAGIPSTWNGTLTGNGYVNIDLPPGNPAPATLSKVHINISSSVIGNYSCTINLSGGASGTFAVTGNSVGSGTFTYTPNGTSARLFLTYSAEFPGDYDDFNLSFNATPTTPNTLTGVQNVSGTVGPVQGTFTYE